MIPGFEREKTTYVTVIGNSTNGPTIISLSTEVEQFNEDGTEVLLADPSNCSSIYQKVIQYQLLFYQISRLGGWCPCFIFVTYHFHTSAPISSALARIFRGFPSFEANAEKVVPTSN
jgi:hypothetical protein